MPASWSRRSGIRRAAQSRPPRSDRRDENSPNYYLDWAFDEMRKLVDTFPKSYTERVFVVRTTIDMNVQRAAKSASKTSCASSGATITPPRLHRGVSSDIDGGVRAIGGRQRRRRQPVQPRKPEMPTGSRARRSSPMSTPPPCSTASRRTPSSSTVRCGFGNWCPQNYGHSYSGAVTLTQAITRSIKNAVRVKLSIAIPGKAATPKGRPRQDRRGRATLWHQGTAAGIRRPPPIGADEVTVLEQAVAYATFPNKGKSVTRHAAMEVRTGAGDLVWRFDRDGKKPLQAVPAHPWRPIWRG